MFFYRRILYFFIIFFYCIVFYPSIAGAEAINTLYSRQGFAGAQYTAMGDCAEAVTSDIFALYWNPAGMLELRNVNISRSGTGDSISDSELIDFSDESENKFFTLGISAAKINSYAKIGYAGIAFSFFNNVLGFAHYSTNCDYITDEGAEDDFYGHMSILGYAFNLGDNVAVGFSGKYYYQKIDDESYHGGGGDIGVQMDLFPFIKAGMVVQHIGSGLKQISGNSENNENYEFDRPTAGFSLAYLSLNSQIIITLGVSRDFEIKETRFKCGAGYSLFKYMYLNIGYIDKSYSGGITLKNNIIDFSYSCSYDKEIHEYNNILSLSVLF